MTNRSPRDRGQQATDLGEPRRRLVAAAASLRAERGYDATTVKEIARQAGLASGLCHHSFRSKDELLLEVIAHLKTEFGAAADRLGGSGAGAAGGRSPPPSVWPAIASSGGRVGAGSAPSSSLSASALPPSADRSPAPASASTASSAPSPVRPGSPARAGTTTRRGTRSRPWPRSSSPASTVSRSSVWPVPTSTLDRAHDLLGRLIGPFLDEESPLPPPLATKKSLLPTSLA